MTEIPLQLLPLLLQMASVAPAAENVQSLKRARDVDEDSDDGRATSRFSPISRSVSSISLSSADEKSGVAHTAQEMERARCADVEPSAVAACKLELPSAARDQPADTLASEPAKPRPSPVLTQKESSLLSRLLTYSYTAGMATAGVNMVEATYELQDTSFGIGLVSRAAAMGSDFAAYNLAMWHDEGSHGLPHDAEEAKYWYEKVVSGACACKHLRPEHMAKAAARVREIEAEVSAWAAAEDAAAAAVEEALGSL